MRKPTLAKAAAFAALAQRTGGAFVFATRDPSVLALAKANVEIAKYKFAEFACNDCGSHHAGVKAAGMAPYCVVCGGDTKEIGSAKPNIPSDSEMAYVQCHSCGTHCVTHEAVASLGSEIHCSVCGAGMKTTADLDEVTDPVPQVDDMELIDVETDADEDITDDLELSDTTMSPADESSDEPLGLDEVVPNSTTQDLPSDTVSDELPADPVAPSTTQQELVANEDSTETVEVDLLEEIDEDEAEMEVSFVYHGAKMSIMHRERIVATLTPELAGDNADMLQTEEFRQAVAHTINTLGLKKAVAQYNFAPKTLKVSLAKTLAKRVSARVKAEAAAYESAQASVMADVEQAVAIAAAGFASNFWRDRVDPLKAALVAEAAALNVRKPEQFVDRIFAAHGVAHLNNVIGLAKELIKKPVEARNALADAIDMSRYQPMVVTAEAEEDVNDGLDDELDDDDDSAEIAAIATRVPTAATASAHGSVYRTPELRQILGDKPLFN